MTKLNYYGIAMVSGDSYEIVQFPLVPLCDDLQTNLAITFRVNDRYRSRRWLHVLPGSRANRSGRTAETAVCGGDVLVSKGLGISE